MSADINRLREAVAKATAGTRKPNGSAGTHTGKHGKGHDEAGMPPSPPMGDQEAQQIVAEMDGRQQEEPRDPQGTTPPAKPSGSTTSAAPIELLAFTPEDVLKPIRQETHLLPGMVPTEAYSLIAGALSSYKTITLIYLLIWRATGYDLLDLDPNGGGCDIGPCVLASYEDTDWRIFARLQRILQDAHGAIGRRHGARAASEFLERAAKNLRRIPLTGKLGKTLVFRHDGAILPNYGFIEELLTAIRAFTTEGVLIGLDPLRLAIVGSQNDDDGADVVVTILNMLSVEIANSGLLVNSHTTKAGAQDPAEGYAGAAYATSGSALYSQHARSNFHLARMKAAEIQQMFDTSDVSADDAKRQAVARLTHGRLSHGPETHERFFRMEKGILVPVAPRSARTANDTIERALPAVAAALERLKGVQVSKKALESDDELRKALGGRDPLRLALTLLVENNLITFEGNTTNRAGGLTDRALSRLGIRESARESRDGAG